MERWSDGESPFFEFQLPDGLCKHGVQGFERLLQHVESRSCGTRYGNFVGNSLWQKLRDWKPRLFLKQPGQERYTPANDADTHFYKSLDLFILATSLGLTEFCKPLLEAVKDVHKYATRISWEATY